MNTTSLPLCLYAGLVISTAPLLSADYAALAQSETSDAEASVEAAVRGYYKHIKVYNFDAMEAAVTPEFEIIYAGVRTDWNGFETRHRAELGEMGPTESRPGRMDYQNTNFEVKIDGDLAYSRSREMNPAGNNYYDYWVLRRDNDEWLIHRIFHMPMQGEPAP